MSSFFTERQKSEAAQHKERLAKRAREHAQREERARAREHAQREQQPAVNATVQIQIKKGGGEVIFA